MYSSFVLYLPEDGHMVGRNTYEVNVLYTLILTHLCTSVGTTYIHTYIHIYIYICHSINARIMDHKGTKCVQGKDRLRVTANRVLTTSFVPKRCRNRRQQKTPQGDVLQRILLWDFRRSLWSKLDPHSSGMLRSVDW